MGSKIGRNQPCPCGSGLKYKKCHAPGNAAPSTALPSDSYIQNTIARHRAQERIREAQQGLGRPIISAKMDNHQVVAVRNTVYFSPTWKTVPDFLADYLKRVMDPEWGNAEIAKPLNDRHSIMQWYDGYCRYQQQHIKKPGEVYSGPITGVVACYLGLAYSLYLLDHNVELQKRFIHRLKNPANFQGAYYELIVANTLIRAGFTLALEDETDAASKHCEFSATSIRTGKKYWVEAKMRSVKGILGKNEKDGGPDKNPTSRLIPHLNKALAKPAADERLIFIDLNAEPEVKDNKPTWHDKAVKRLEQYESNELKPNTKAYIFVTNMAFHRRLAEPAMIAAAPFGLGMQDFNRPGFYRLSDIYRRKQKHIDAYHIGESLMHYTQFPQTFDGSLPSEAFGKSLRTRIGETYFFEGIGENGLVGTVTCATVNEDAKEAFIGVSDSEGRGQILRQPMSEDEMADYKAHPDAYFGQVVLPSRKIDDPYEFFEWLMEAHKESSRAILLERLSKVPNFDDLKNLSDRDLLAEYCEAMVGLLQQRTAQSKQEKGDNCNEAI